MIESILISISLVVLFILINKGLNHPSMKSGPTNKKFTSVTDSTSVDGTFDNNSDGSSSSE